MASLRKVRSRAKQGDVHYPHRNGAVCGLVFTDARDYSMNADEVSCVDCSEYLEGLASRGPHPSRTDQPPPRPSRSSPASSSSGTDK